MIEGLCGGGLDGAAHGGLGAGMKAIILAGGLGSRLSEETVVRPKPMVEVGGLPILWHIMKTYSHYGVHDFVICLGYKGHLIKEYFANFFLYSADVTFDIGNNRVEYHQNHSEPWRVTLIETGNETLTGGRLKRALPYVAGEEAFCFTYGDGVTDVDISALIGFHRRQKTLVTLTAVQPAGKYGVLDIEGDKVGSFAEKPGTGGGWVNGGYFVLSPKVGEYIEGDQTSWETGPLVRLAAEGQVSAYQHRGFWQSMDTIHERNLLEEYWKSGHAPWKVWE